MTRETLRDLTHDICRYLTNLEHFSFHFPRQGKPFHCDSESLIAISQRMKILRSSYLIWAHLELDVEWVTVFGNKSKEGLNYLLEQHSKRLKNLSLNFGKYMGFSSFSGSCLKEEDCEEIIKDITTRLEDLQKLKLKLNGVLTDKGINNISKQVFKSLSKLTHFSLETNEQITDKGLKDMISAFKLKKNPLQQFKLNILSSPYISNEGFDVLMGGIANYLPELQDLELNFPNCKKIGSSALRSLALKVIRPSFNLKILKLNFSSCRGIKGKGLEELLIEIVNQQQSWESVNLVLERIGDFGNSDHKISSLLASCPLIKWKINNY